MADERSASEHDRRLGAAEALATPPGHNGDDRPPVNHVVSVALQWLAMTASQLVEIDEARRRVLAAVSPLAGETVQLGAAALGRVLAEEITSEEPVPAFDSSAMDGFAVRAEDLVGARSSRPIALRVTGESRAGTPASNELAGGEAIEILAEGFARPFVRGGNPGREIFARSERKQAHGRNVREAILQR